MGIPYIAGWFLVENPTEKNGWPGEWTGIAGPLAENVDGHVQIEHEFKRALSETTTWFQSFDTWKTALHRAFEKSLFLKPTLFYLGRSLQGNISWLILDTLQGEQVLAALYISKWQTTPHPPTQVYLDFGSLGITKMFEPAHGLVFLWYILQSLLGLCHIFSVITNQWCSNWSTGTSCRPVGLYSAHGHLVQCLQVKSYEILLKYGGTPWISSCEVSYFQSLSPYTIIF